MTILQVINALEKIALTQHNIRSVGHSDLYKFMNANPSVKYSVFYITQNQHQRVDEMDIFGLNLFVIDRLVNVDGDNSLEIQSIAKSLLDNIINTFCEMYDADITGNIVYQPFTQDFGDLCAGCYAIVNLQVPVDTICVED